MSARRIPRILVADDNRDHREAIAKTFERAGYGVTTPADGREALRVLTRRQFDLVISDLSMPSMNGLELLQNIRAMNAQLPVLIMTAFGEWSTYIQAMDGGCVDYLSKPARRSELLVAARKALTRRDIRIPDCSVGVPGGGSEITNHGGAVRE